MRPLTALAFSIFLLLAPQKPVLSADPATLNTLATGAMLKFIVLDKPRPVADMPFFDQSGQERHLSDFRGQVVLVNLWATWCIPCRAEMPALDRLQQKLAGQPFALVAIAQERAGAAQAKAFLDEVGVRTLKLYVDPTTKSSHAWRAVGLPTSILLNRQGEEIGRLVGEALWDSDEAVRLIEAAQKE